MCIRDRRSYIKKGIEDWQIAFEKAGFKNAIIAKEITDSMHAVSYTHLDVYKRQVLFFSWRRFGSANGGCLNINKDHWKQYGINGLGSVSYTHLPPHFLS